MKSRSRVVFVLSLAIAICVSGIYALLSHEPTYQGRRLSRWLRDFDDEPPEKCALAANAVRNIGTNAVPFLVKRLQHTSPDRYSRFTKLKQNIWELWNKYSPIKMTLRRPPDPRREALAGLDALGPDAKDAIPALEKLLHEDPPDPAALYVIARIGEQGLPLITQSLTNSEKVIRLEARVCLEMIKTKSAMLFPKFETEPESSDYRRRICEFNSRTLREAFKDYRAQHPEQFDANGGPVSSPPPEMPPAIGTNGVNQGNYIPASTFE